VIPNGIDAKGIREARPLQVPDPQRPRVICMARLAAQKNQLKLIEAMPRIVSRVPSITLQLLGDGPDLSVLKVAAAELRVSDSVQFAGFQQNVWSWMKAADIAVLVSHFEGTPNVALEAAAAGCPMVLSNIPAHRAAFSDAEALFVDKDDPASIAAGILRLLEDLDLRKNMIRLAADRVATLTIDAAVSRYLDLYCDVAGR
jgi:glycosyltransferase involved in cell wall biosynthesis